MKKYWTGRVKVDRSNYASTLYPVGTFAEIKIRGMLREKTEWESIQTYKTQQEAVDEAERLSKLDLFNGLPKYFGGPQ